MSTSLTPSTGSPLIAVVGATGKQGGSVVDALLARGARVRALVRDPDKPAAQSLADRGVQLSIGDLGDAASLDALFDGVDAAFAMTTPLEGGTERETEVGIAIADAAARVGVPHLVLSTVGGAERESGVPHFESKRRVEEHIEALGIHHTFLRPVLFMDNLSGFATSVEGGEVVVRLALPDGIPLQMVAVRDIGRAAAAILLGGTAVEGESIEIAGDTLTGSQIAKTIGAYAGLPARYEALPLEAIAAFGDTADMFRWFAETPAYQADFEATRALVPDALDLPAWLAASGWHLAA
ncbi:NmrA/HSCARG family protein [Diaminobutyricibacter tongyongensis]|uniref:NmrA/HSCARG family protein n=1 Tax=Leifsonia tongyongensis TaxID=1268043 RepID=A0A6L9XVZ1_9MICO|nr:NmrA/HSCARG family protein [Diaminobutyricibacter tongyongensis]NEN05387.1 NmrA/HSCARG family protein [Diaminobutyricibacter tongyongensis]